uniref:Uncharacterized protein n=1 Tax=Oryza meridionalis TaxID=40149 RepID=A0A0E0DYY2_9ORYZ
MAACGCGHHAEIDSTTPPSSCGRRASAMAARGYGRQGRRRRYARTPSPSSSMSPPMKRSAAHHHRRHSPSHPGLPRCPQFALLPTPAAAAAHLAVSTPDFDAAAGALFACLGGRARRAVEEGGAAALASDKADVVPLPPCRPPPFLCLVGLVGGGRWRSPCAAPPPTSPVAGCRRPPPPVG